MNCPRPHCGGLLIADEDEQAQPFWRCHACSRHFTRTRGQVDTVPEPMDSEDQPVRKHAVRRCGGRQGRGQCKKDAASGSDYCPFHTGRMTMRPAAADGALPLIRDRLGKIRDQIGTLQQDEACLERALVLLGEGHKDG